MSGREVARDEDGAPVGGSIGFMARNPVGANVLMVLLIVGGLFTLPSIKQEVFPEFSLDTVNVSIAYPGASPAEVEQATILAIEEAVRGIDGIEKVISTAREGGGSVGIELEAGVNIQRVFGEIESGVDRITSFPADVERPVISLLSNRREVISIILYGDLDEWSRRALAEEMREELLQDPDISVVELAGVRPFEISIEIPQETLRRYDLTLEGVAQRIRRASVELPGGGVKTTKGEILLRTDERRDVGSQFRDIVLRENGRGSELRLADVATIRDGFQDTDQAAFYEGKPAAMLRIFRVGDQTPIDVADAAREFVARRGPTLPAGVGLALWNDFSEAYAGRLDLLIRNAKVGLVLVLGILGLFLDFRLAFWITLGIPISFCGALLFFPWFDVSLNMVSLFAFILTLGIVVDDAIVVGESVYKKREEGMSGIEAAIAGTLEVAGPVTFSILTTIIAFLPLLFVPDVMGKIMRVLPLVVIAILILSLVESMFVLPAHLVHSKITRPRGVLGYLYDGQRRFARVLDWWIENIYSPSLRRMLESRYVTMAVGVAILLVTHGLVKGKRINFTFLPRIDSDLVTATVTMPFGVNADRTREVVSRLEATAKQALEELGGGGDVGRGVFGLVGATAGGGHGRGNSGASGSHLGQVQVSLVPEDRRPFSSGQFHRTWRELLGPVAGVDSLKFKSTSGPSGGSDIDVELTHTNRVLLEEAAGEVAEALHGFAGVHDIDDGVAAGKQQLNLQLTPQGRAWGFSELDLARAVRGAFFGHEALRQQRGRHEVRTYVRLPEAERRSEHDIDRFLLLTDSGKEIELAQAARIRRGRAHKEIKRRDGRRVMNVTAEVDEQVTNAGRVLEEMVTGVLVDVKRQYPGVEYSFSGAEESRAKSLRAMARGFALALVAMFALLAVAFRSYVQPVLIMLAIPFGAAGATWGHVVMGMDLSLMSMFGFVALAGVVVNDSLVLISAMNTYIQEGMSPFEAVFAGSVRRFRPIMLTSLTTFLGLIPMLLEKAQQARFLIPMAVSLGVGVLFATFITLVIIPCAYLILEDLVWAARTAAAGLGLAAAPKVHAP